MTLDYYIVTKRGVVLKDTKENRKQAHEIIKDYQSKKASTASEEE